MSAFHHESCEMDSKKTFIWQCLSVTCDRSVVFPVYSTNNTDRHDMSEILLKVALDTITPEHLKYVTTLSSKYEYN